MGIDRVQKSSLVQAIAEQIEGAIIDGTYNPGDKLPALPKLQKIVGTSQGTLREALRILEQKGLLEIRLGIKGGAFIRESSTDSVAEGLGLLIKQRTISYKEIAVFRKVVEAGLMKLVVENVTSRDIDLLKENLLRMSSVSLKNVAGWPEFLDIEVVIRKLLIKIANNKMFETVLVPIHENIFAYARQLFSTNGFLPKDAYNDWTEIIKAIDSKNEEQAVKLTIQHIERYVDTVSVNTGEEKI